MLLIYGIAAMTAGAVLTAIGGLVIKKETASASLRRLFGGQTFSVISVSLMGVGGLVSLIFLAQYDTQPAVPLQLGVSVALIVAGYVGVRLVKRWAGAGTPTAEPSAAEPADPGKRAA